MKLKDLIVQLDKMTQIQQAAPWDNCGLLLGDETKEIQKALVALEITDDCIKEAVEQNAQIIIAHHPVLFSPIRSVVRRNNQGNPIFTMVESGIAAYACHTNFDALPGGTNDYFARLLHGYDISLLEEEKNSQIGIGRIFTLENPCSVENLAIQIKRDLAIEDLRIIGNKDKVIQRVGIVTGSGGDMVERAFEEGAQVFITGDIKYHEAQEMLQKGYIVIDAAHYGTEKFFSQAFCQLMKSFQGDIEFMESQLNVNPFTMVKA